MLKPIAFITAFLALIVLLVIVEFFGGAPKPTIFAPLDFAQAQSRAAESSPPRLLVVQFTTEHCAACDEMDKKVWTNPELVDWLNRRAVVVKIDRDKDPGHARSLGIQTTPAVVLLDGKKPLTRLEGPQTARNLIDKFNAAVAAHPAASPAPPAPATKPAEPAKNDAPSTSPKPKPADPPIPPPPGAATFPAPSRGLPR